MAPVSATDLVLEVLMVLTLLPPKVPTVVDGLTRPSMIPLSSGPLFYYPGPGAKAILELESPEMMNGLVFYPLERELPD